MWSPEPAGTLRVGPAKRSASVGATEVASSAPETGGVATADWSFAAHTGHKPLGDSITSGPEHRLQALDDDTRSIQSWSGIHTTDTDATRATVAPQEANSAPHF